MIDAALVKRLQDLKRQRSDIQTLLQQKQGQINASRDRYTNIMSELKTLGIGSLDELRSRIDATRTAIIQEMDMADASLATIREKLSGINNQEVSTAKLAG